MTLLLTDELILRIAEPTGPLTGREALRLTETLGVFGRFSLRPEVLSSAREAAARHTGESLKHLAPPILPTGFGTCWIVVAVQANQDASRFRSAFPIVLQWKKSAATERGEHDPRLPPTARNLADSVIDTVRNDGYVSWDDKHSWTLHLSEAAGYDVNLNRQSCITWESGWVSLLAGLMTAMAEGIPNTQVWATGCWLSSHGVKAVDDSTLPHKIQVARDFGATTFFVPAENLVLGMKTVADEKFSILPLKSGKLNASESLEDYLEFNKTEPGPSATIDTLRQYYHSIRDKTVSERFRKDRLMEETTERLRQQVSQQSDRRFDELVTVVSFSDSLIEQGVSVVEPKRCMLLYTPSVPKLVGEAVRARDDLTARGIATTLFPLTHRPEVSAEIARIFSESIQDPGRTLIDLTSGPKLMSYMMAHEAPVESWHVIWWHEMIGNRVLAGSEQAVLWKAHCKPDVVCA